MTITYYEKDDKGYIARSTDNLKVAQLNGYANNQTTEEIVSTTLPDGTNVRMTLSQFEEYKSTDEYKVHNSQLVAKELIEFTYQTKANKAYGGVIIETALDDLIFETNKEAISFVIGTLGTMNDTETRNWKFWSTKGVPIMVPVNKIQLSAITAFASMMVDNCFAIEGQQDNKIYAMTTEQLNDPEYIQAFKQETIELTNAVNNVLDFEKLGGN